MQPQNFNRGLEKENNIKYIMAGPVRPNYNCTDNQLYILAGMYATNMSDNLAAFTTHSPRFVAGFVTNLITQMTNAEAMPNSIQLKEGKMTNRVDLIPVAKVAITDLNVFKTYLIPAYPTTFAIMYNMTGAAYRTEAGNKNWPSVKALFKAMADFLAVPAHVTQLLLNNVMPSTFPAKILADQLAFNNLYDTFLASKVTTSERDAKITQNNVVHAILMDIGVNADVIFEAGTATHNLFVFEKQKAIIAPAGSASLKVGLELDVVFTKLVGIPVKIQAEGQPAITVNTDINGNAHFEGIDPTRYKVTIIGPDLVSMEFDKDVDTGVNARVEVIMESVAVAVVEDTTEEVEEPVQEEKPPIKKEEKEDKKEGK